MMKTIQELLTANPSNLAVPFSMEFYPPRNIEEEFRLWKSIWTMQELGASFVSVTYSPSAKNINQTKDLCAAIKKFTNLTPLAHFTAVNQSIDSLNNMLNDYQKHEIENLLILRGDPPEDPLAPWIKHPQGVEYASELLEIANKMNTFDLSVAAFPEKHMRSVSLEFDAQVLADKFRKGATSAVTQMFFNISDYFELIERVAKISPEFEKIPIIPGIMPVTSVRLLKKLLTLSGSDFSYLPKNLRNSLEKYSNKENENSSEIRKIGIEFATELCQKLIDFGIPGIQFCALNYTKSTRDVLTNLYGSQIEEKVKSIIDEEEVNVPFSIFN